ncbi:MAG TPA: LD-carboxypeptidase, partial [Clostridiaceae bacterium]|nr:LD-carboxypeptidase [Clostridiaceae bacterium]
FNDILKPLHIPVIYNVKAGHCTSKISLPFGTTAYIDADNCKLIIEESAVK